MFIVSSSLDRIADLYEAGTLGLIEHDGWVEAFTWAPDSRSLYFTSHVGARSAHAVEILRGAGFSRARHLQGGYAAWMRDRR